jgi:flavin reductase (DIM6/NTAB) family NADH-FMN oxidoreductase RutF
VDERGLRDTFATFATGVTVVTVGGPDPHGMTANSFTAVSLDPPMLLVCVDRRNAMHARLYETRKFAVSVLAGGQEEVAAYFSDRRRPAGAEQFHVVDAVPGPRTGAPLIAGAVAHFECEVCHRYDGGDHTIVVGRLIWSCRHASDESLIFLSGRYTRATTARTGH